MPKGSALYLDSNGRWIAAYARVAPFALLQTVFAIGTGILFLYEKASVPLVVGASICIAGVVLTQAGANASQATALRKGLFRGRAV